MEGVASWYGADFNGRLTASGEVYDMYEYTAAHKTLPLGTVVKVTNLESGKSTEVRINDRGPYVEGRIIDLSRTAGRAIGIRETGITKVKLEIVRMPKG
jgi:rare lipoprotein A